MASTPQEKQGLKAMLLSHDNLEKDYRREDDNISKLIKWPSSHVVKMIYFEVPPQTTFHKIAIFLY